METDSGLVGGNSLPEALFIAFEVMAGRAVPSAELARSVGQATIRAQIAQYMRMHMLVDVFKFMTKKPDAVFNAELHTRAVLEYVDCLDAWSLDSKKMGEMELLAAARMQDVPIVVCRSDVDAGYLTIGHVVNGYRYGLRPTCYVLQQHESTYLRQLVRAHSVDALPLLREAAIRTAATATAAREAVSADSAAVESAASSAAEAARIAALAEQLSQPGPAAWADWIVEAADVPSQTNGIDCGVFMLINLIFLVRGRLPVSLPFILSNPQL